MGNISLFIYYLVSFSCFGDFFLIVIIVVVFQLNNNKIGTRALCNNNFCCCYIARVYVVFFSFKVKRISTTTTKKNIYSRWFWFFKTKNILNLYFILFFFPFLPHYSIEQCARMMWCVGNFLFFVLFYLLNETNSSILLLLLNFKFKEI